MAEDVNASLDQRLAELEKKHEELKSEHHNTVREFVNHTLAQKLQQDSRRGAEGARGEKGERGEPGLNEDQIRAIIQRSLEANYQVFEKRFALLAQDAKRELVSEIEAFKTKLRNFVGAAIGR